MLSRKEYQRLEKWSFSSLRGMVVVSLVLHLMSGGLFLLLSSWASPPPKRSYSAYRVNLVTLPTRTGEQQTTSFGKPEADSSSATQDSRHAQPQQESASISVISKGETPPDRESTFSQETKPLKETKTSESKTVQPEQGKETAKISPPEGLKTKGKEITPAETKNRTRAEKKNDLKPKEEKASTNKEKSPSPPTQQAQKQVSPLKRENQKTTEAQKNPKEEKTSAAVEMKKASHNEGTKPAEKSSSGTPAQETSSQAGQITTPSPAPSAGTEQGTGGQARFSLNEGSSETGSTGGVAVDKVDFPFLYYLRIIEQKISQHWTPPANAWRSGPEKRVVIGFQIQRDGRIVKPVIKESSGIEFFDQTAVRAVLSADPLPPLPSEFAKDYLDVYFGFTLADTR